MALVSATSLLGKAYATGAAVTAIEVSTLEQAEAAVLGAEQAGRPVLLQVGSAGARFHLGDPEPFGAALTVLARASLVDVALHLDHVTGLGLLRRAAACGFSSALVAVEHVDADAGTYEDYVVRVTEAVAVGRADGLLVGAELGQVGTDGLLESPHLTGVRTDPGLAARFVAATGVDALSVAVGDRGTCDLDLVRRLRAAVGVPLLLADASDVPQSLLTEAVAAGLTSVAFASTPALAFTQAIRRHLHDLPGLADPTQYLAPARKAMSAVVAELVATVSQTL